MSIVAWNEETDVDLANAGGQDLASVARLGDGGAGSNNGFAVAWAEQTESGWSIKTQVYGFDGQPIGSEVTVATGIADLISVDARQTQGTGSSFTITWNDGSSFQSRVFDSFGVPLGDAQPAVESFGENYAHLGSATQVQLAVVGDDIFASVISVHLSIDPFPVNSTPLSGETATSVARIGGDWRFASAWSSLNGDGQYEVRVSSFYVGTEPPTALHPEILVDTDLGTTPVQPEVVSVNGGGFIVIWLDGDAGQIEAQEFSLSGERLGDVFVVNDLPLGNLDDVKISAISVIDGRVVVTWETAGDVHMKILDPGETGGGGPGGEELVGTSGDDILVGGAGDDHLSGLGGDDQLFGMAGSDHLLGGDDDDQLDGGDDVDTLEGGPGNDTYYVDDLGDVIVEAEGGGNDRVNTFIDFDYQLAPFVETLVMLGSADMNGTGNDLANSLVGNSGANVLNGQGGADYLVGNGGNDTFVVDNIGDLVVERGPADGYDRVLSFIDYRLGSDVEQLDLLGTADLDGTGNNLANTLVGNSGDNILNGKGGADYMVGNGGDDIFVVDNAGDLVLERTAADGYDRVLSYIDYRLGANVEQIDLIGSADIDATGNDLANSLIGNSGDNILNGKGGADYMVGNGGDDTFIVDDAGDQVVERSAADGYDRVNSSIDYRLGAHVEQVVLVGSADLVATGNDLANTLVGNSGDNVLNGKVGADYMVGNGGDDTFIVDDAGDQVVERSAADGTDRVTSSVDYRLGSHVEQLVLAGNDAIDGTGNELANIIVGNSAANVLNGKEGADDLNGAAGNDRLIGGAGNDILRGGAGSDGFYFGAPLDWLENVDTIADFFAPDDTIFLDRAVFSAFGQTGAISEDQFVIGSAAQDAEDRLVYDQSTGNIFYDADGAGGADATLFAQVAPATTLSFADFVVF